MNFFALFLRASSRRLLMRPLATLLLLLSIALASAVFVATLYTSFASVESFEASMQSFGSSESVQLRSRTGTFKSSLVREVMSSVPSEVLIIAALEGQLLVEAEVTKFAPLLAVAVAASAGNIEGSATLPPGLKGGEAGISEALAFELGLKTGDRLRLRSGSIVRKYRARVLNLQPGAPALPGILLTMEDAQTLLAREGEISSLTLIPPAGAGALARALESSIAEAGLASLLFLDTRERRGATASQLLAAFRGNIFVLVLITCAVCAFAILNAAHLSTLSMQEELRVLRTLGVSRTQIVLLVLLEYLLLGALGAVIGLSLGQPLSGFLVQLLSDTVRDLYLGGTSFPEFGGWSAARFYGAGFAAGVACSVFGALVPALRASRVRGGFALAGVRAQAELRWKSAIALGLALIAGSLLCSTLAERRGDIPLSHAAALLLVAALFAFAVPLTTGVNSRMVAPLFEAFGLRGLVARANIGASLGSHSFLLGVSSLALSVLVALGVMVGSFRQALEDWASYTFRADVFVRMAERGDPQNPVLIPQDFVDRLRSLPQVQELSRYTALHFEQDGQLLLVAAADLEIGLRRGVYRLLQSQGSINIGARPGCVLLNESAGRKLAKNAGDSLSLAGSLRTVCGIYQDFSTERATVLMDYAEFIELFGPRDPINLALYARPGNSAADLREQALKEANPLPVLATLNADLRRLVVLIFDQTFRITTVLQVIVALMSAFGFVVSLLQLLRERSRDFKTLYTLGLSLRGLQGGVFLEGIALTIPAILLGCCGGTLLSLLLIEVINPVSFGWSFEPRFAAGHYGVAALILLVANAAASLLPLRVGTESIRSARLSEE